MQSSTKTMSRLLAEAMVVCLLTLTFTPRAGAQEPQDGSSAVSLQRDITLLLLDKDVGAVANQLANEHATTVAPLIRQLEIFLRAGHPDRVRQTIAQLAEASDWRSNSHSWFVKTTVTSAIPADDLRGWRFFYERLYPNAFGSEAFLQMWERQGNPAELDSWLAARSLGNSGWFSLRLARLAKMGRANEVLDPLAAEVKVNPRDWSRVERYLRANMMAGNVQDVVWLADVYQAKSACENYELGEWLQSYAPAVAVNSFKKSLTLPFTEPDTVCVQRQFRVSSMPPKVNWEKQLRFWTKRSLAETYQTLHRAKEAQPLVEELVAMKDVDIVTAEIHQLAGAVQAASGARVVEGRVLQDEASKRDKAEYWLQRAGYYRGRDEFELEEQSYRKALEAFPYSNDSTVLERRFEIVKSFAFSLASRNDGQERIAKLLRREFNLGPPGTLYAFQIASLIVDNEFELEDLKRALFVDRPNTLAQLLESREQWDRSEERLIEGGLSRQEIAPDQLDKIWSALERLVKEPGSLRAYHLASTMFSLGAEQRAAPLFEGYLKHAKPGDDVDWDQVFSALVRVYCSKGNWQAAEKLLFSNKDLSWPFLSTRLSQVAVAAAQHGAPEDALRLWRLKANLDRRDLTGLEQLSQTGARQPIRDFYLLMKKDDPLTQAPDSALRFFQ